MSEGLPDGWAVAALGEVAKIVTGKTPSTKQRDLYGGEIPFVKPGDLDQRPPLSQAAATVTDAGADHAPRLPPGSVLVSCIGNLGKLAILQREAICNQQINAVLPSSALNPRFTYYWARTIRPWMEANASATTVTILNKGRFMKAPVQIPPLNEQRRIVEKIEALMARSRRAKEALDAIPPLLERFRQSVLAAAFRGDLTADWRAQNPDVEPADQLLERIRAERRRRWEEDYLAKQRAKGKKPKNDKWKAKYEEPERVDHRSMPPLPDGWCWARWSEVGLSQNGRAFPSKLYCDDGIKLLRPGNLHVSGEVRWPAEATRFLPTECAERTPATSSAAES